jgi:hypothetical protein
MGGAVEIRSDFVGLVPVPAEVAALTGETASYEVRKVHYYSYGFGGNYTRRFQTSSLSASLTRGFSPGNGVLLAGLRDMAFLSYSMFENRKVGLHATALGIRSSSALTSLRRTSIYSAGLGTSYRLYRQLLMNFSVSYQETQIPHVTRGRGLFASAGLVWSPREFAIAF